MIHTDQERIDEWIRAWLIGSDVGRPPDDLLDSFIDRYPESMAMVEHVRVQGRPQDKAWEDGEIYANIHPSVLAQLDRIETMLLAQIHLLTITTGPGRYDAKVSGRCACGWTLSIQGRSHDVQAAHAAHIYELMHPERNPDASTPQDPDS